LQVALYDVDFGFQGSTYAPWVIHYSDKICGRVFIKRITVTKHYVNVKIPVELADEVDKILDKKLLGYRSRAEFVAEAVRDKLIQVKKS
jgi:hypothetical protein